MLYVCLWKTKRSEGTIEVDTHTATDARKLARAVLRDARGLRVKIVAVEKWASGTERQKSI
jgi:hypothetical protein